MRVTGLRGKPLVTGWVDIAPAAASRLAFCSSHCAGGSISHQHKHTDRQMKQTDKGKFVMTLWADTERLQHFAAYFLTGCTDGDRTQAGDQCIHSFPHRLHV